METTFKIRGSGDGRGGRERPKIKGGNKYKNRNKK